MGRNKSNEGGMLGSKRRRYLKIERLYIKEEVFMKKSKMYILCMLLLFVLIGCAELDNRIMNMRAYNLRKDNLKSLEK